MSCKRDHVLATMRLRNGSRLEIALLAFVHSEYGQSKCQVRWYGCRVARVRRKGYVMDFGPNDADTGETWVITQRHAELPHIAPLSVIKTVVSSNTRWILAVRKTKEHKYGFKVARTLKRSEVCELLHIHAPEVDTNDQTEAWLVERLDAVLSK